MKAIEVMLGDLLKKFAASHKRENAAGEVVTVEQVVAGTLCRHIGKNKDRHVVQMKVSGELNSSDVYFLRNMPRLEILDLSDAQIVEGGNYYIESMYCQNRNDTMGLYMFYRCAQLYSIVFPKSVRMVRSCAFRRCTSLKEVVFSDVMEKIGECAFSYCESLESIQFPASLEIIQDMAFAHCKSLRSVELPDSVTTLGKNVFEDCQTLTSVILSSSLQSVGAEVFKGCLHLAAIHAKGKVPADAAPDAFDGMDVEGCVLYVPRGTKHAYAIADGWWNFENIVEE